MRTFSEKDKLDIYDMYSRGLGTVTISRIMHTSPSKIKVILADFGIDIHNPLKIVGKHSKPCGYWKNREVNEGAASKCRNRREFAAKFLSAYKIAKKTGWILEYDKKYFTGGIKYTSFDEPIHVVYAYEVTETNSVYVGRTMNLKRRDLCHRNKTQNDTLYKHCEENGINIPEVKVLEQHLIAIQSQEWEDFWKNDYAAKGWNIINKASTGMGSSSLGSTPRKWYYETCRDAAEQCDSKENFKKRFVGAYNVSRKNGWLKEFFPVSKKKENGCFETLDACIEAAKPYKSIMEIRHNYPFLYHKILKHKWVEEVRKHLNKL